MAVGGTGFLNSVTTKIREYTDELATATSKFSDARLLDMVRRAYSDIMDDVNRTSTGSIRARFDVSVASDLREYVLPPTIGRFLEFKKLDSSGNFCWEIVPRHPLSPSGPGFTIEGPILRLDPVWKSSETLRIEYVPSASAPIFEATSVVFDASTLKVSQPVAGTISLKANSYLGYVLRVLSEGGGTQQDRVISKEDRSTPSQPVFTLEPDFSPALSTTATFEVVPSHIHRFEDAIALKCSRFISSVIGNTERVQALQSEYVDAIRSLKLAATQTERRTGHRMVQVVRGRRRYGRTR